MNNTDTEIKFSIIIPAYNAERTISPTLEALLSQEGVDSAEIIVVNDGSTDSTADLIRKYPVRLIQQQNAGPASARNLGVAKARGEIILFIDSDCIPQPGWLKAMIEPFEDQSIRGVKGIYINKNKSLIVRFIQLEFEERYLMLKGKSTIDFVDSYSAAFRKETFLKVGGFDESFPKADNEDVDLSYKISRAGYRMVFQPQAVVEHLGHPNNIIKYIKVKFSRGYWRTAVYKKHPGKALKDSYTPQTLKLQIALALMIWLTLFLGIFTEFWNLFFISVSCFFLLSLSFIIKLKVYDPAPALLAPFFHFLRATCFIAGIAVGLKDHFFKKSL